VKEENVEKRWK